MRRLRLLLAAASALPAALCLLTPTAAWWFPGEVACHWGMHAGFALLPALIVWRERRVLSAGMLVLIILGCWPLLLTAWENRAPHPTASAATIRVASANLNVYNAKELRAPAIAAVLAQRPQIVALAEAVTSSDRPVVPMMDYPYQIWQPQLNRKWRDCVALLSVYPIIHSAIHDLDDDPFIEATLDVDGRHLHVIAVHTQSPWSPAHLGERDEQLRDIAALAADLVQRDPAPVLLMGDCNLSVASPVWRTFRQASGLLRVSQNEPSTWRSELGPLGITIDHILGRDLALGEQHAFAIPGSDHRGLSGTIALPAAAH